MLLQSVLILFYCRYRFSAGSLASFGLFRKMQDRRVRALIPVNTMSYGLLNNNRAANRGGASSGISAGPSNGARETNRAAYQILRRAERAMRIGVVFFRRYGRRYAGRSDKKAVCILPDFAKRRIGLPAKNSKIALKRPETMWMKARFAAFFVHFLLN